MARVVGIEMAVCDRPSFHEWYPWHLESVLKLVDHLHVRVGDPVDEVVQHLPKEVTWERQKPKPGRFFDEAFERQELLSYALDSGAEWAVCFDADEVIYSGWETIRTYMNSPDAMIWGVHLNYASHHRHGYVLPRAGINPWRGFRLDETCKNFRYQGDADGLHCGSVVPHARGQQDFLTHGFVVHYHATTPQEYMAERAFYADTTEVEKHGGIDFLYRCDRFGSELQARPLADWLAA
jgi:hypothetical protein